jgi:hypothetical protein
MSTNLQEQANYKQLAEDMEAELARVKKDASEHAAQLSAAAQAKGEAASAARSEAARSRVRIACAYCIMPHSQSSTVTCDKALVG